MSAIRTYALDRLADSGELQGTWQRALDWLTGLLEPTAGRLFADQIGGAPATEQENLAAAVAYATDRDGRPPLGLALALARVRFQQEQLTAARALLIQVLAQNDGALHIWAADGKAGDHDENPIRRPALDYTDTETFEILRRYQGFGDKAVSDAQLRMPLYAIFEKYDRIIRES
ncbi:hypothetical protein [Streptomyces sp. NPDC018833]|uniref:hypothetical protein n=1 Tax=Streptomyces sp. NPDC018833 TaxID=3365053 RepID=UPI00379BF7FD